MFVDTSGFTRMTQELMKNGQEGAELIAQAINKIFTPAVQIVYENYGFITHFAGDAFNAVFPGKFNCLSELFVAAWKNRISFTKNEHFTTKFGDYLISVKIGLAYGEINWKIIGQDNHYTYYYAGSAIDQASESEKLARKNEIIFPGEFIEKINPAEVKIQTQKIDGKYYKLNKLIVSRANKHHIQTLKKDEQKCFYPEKLLTGQVNEFRDVTSCFISISGEQNKDQLISEIVKLTDTYQGYFNRVNFGDKGCFILILFGAPVTPEDIVARSCSFALKILDLSGKIKIGMTHDRAFAGFIGSNIRAEYTAQGSSVNLAARMMTKAQPGQILVNKALAELSDRKFEIVCMGEMKFKGFSKDVAVYQLKSEYGTSPFPNNRSDLRIFGRDDSIKYFTDRIDDLVNKCSFQGIAYLDGNMGTGKTCLLDKVQEMHSGSNIYWLYCPCNQIIQSSFNPFIFWLKNHFNMQTGKNNKFEKFQQIYQELISTCPDQEIKDELIRTKSIIGALLGIFWEGSLYETLSPRERYNNMFQAMKNMIIAKTLTGPVVLRIEDIQHIDNDSLKFINYLLTGISQYPLLVIATSRSGDNGELIDLKVMNAHQTRLNLNNLDREAAKSIVMDIIGSTEISEKHIEFIYKESGGNPFYIIQLTQYLMDNNLLDEESELINGDFQVPSTINSIVMSRIDRLEIRLKNLVKTAAVIGSRFSLAVLKKIIQEDYLEFLLDQGIRQNLWLNEQKNLYSFVNLLLCEVAYQMQMKQTLREIHRSIGQVLEELYQDNLEEYYFEILEHYTRAEVEDKIKDYLMKSAKYAKKNYLNELSLKYFQTLLQYYPQPDEISDAAKYSESEIEFMVEDVIEIYKQMVDLKDELGQWESALQDLKKLKKYLDNYQDNKGNYVYFNNLGLIYFSKADYSTAKKYLQKSLKQAEEIGDINLIIAALNSLGVLFLQTRKFDQADKNFLKILKLAEDLEDYGKVGSVLGNRGRIYHEKKELEKAEDYYKQALNLFEKIKNKRSIALTTLNLGAVYSEMGKLDLALEYYQKNCKSVR
ncbi:MAG: tetratricopeptide repeat protein [bacterium]